MAKSRRRPVQSVRPHPLPTTKDDDAIQRLTRQVEELTKALQLPAGAVATPVSAGYLQQLALRGQGQSYGSAALARDLTPVAFGPGIPLVPAPLDPPMASGRPAPRRWEAPQTWNLQTSTTRAIPWSVLRDSADQVSIMRSCIEVNKSAITGLEWSFGINSSRAKRLAKREGVAESTVTSDLQDKYADELDRLHHWWSRPDRINNWNFSEWLGALLEDQLVLDAVSLYPHLNLKGELHSLELLDSTTIKPLLDHRGATPQPPLAAFQQILWGFPRGEYEQTEQAMVDAEFVSADSISAVYGRIEGPHARTDALIYKVRNRRSKGPYGFSNVEQALTDVDLWLKRYDWLRAEYTAGVAPEMLINVDADMTPEQLRQYEAVFNDDLSGRNQERHRARFLPAGFEAAYPQSHDAKFNSDFDLHLIRLICAAFDVLPTSVGFTPNHGMGGAGGSGHQQGEHDSQLMRGTKPTATWVANLINEVSHNYLNMPPEVAFQFHGLDPEDEQKEAALLTSYLGSGIMTLNETRDARNLPRYTVEQADEPFTSTPTGPAFFNPDVQPVGMPGNLPSAAQNQPGAPQPNEDAKQLPAGNSPAKPAAAKPKPDDAKVQAKKAEQKAFMTFIAKRAGSPKWRDFTFEAHDEAMSAAANNLAAAGDIEACKALFELSD